MPSYYNYRKDQVVHRYSIRNTVSVRSHILAYNVCMISRYERAQTGSALPKQHRNSSKVTHAAAQKVVTV